MNLDTSTLTEQDAPKKQIAGKYNLYGYIVYIPYQEILYHAGNARFESTTYVSPDSSAALTLDSIRKFCEHTTREMAEEQNAEYTGIQFDYESEQNKRAPI